LSGQRGRVGRRRDYNEVDDTAKKQKAAERASDDTTAGRAPDGVQAAKDEQQS
jgi:hypothetical protein